MFYSAGMQKHTRNLVWFPETSMDINTELYLMYCLKYYVFTLKVGVHPG